MVEPNPEQSPFPTQDQIVSLYAQIEETAINIIRSGNAIGNPLLAEGSPKDRRYAISVDTYVEPQSPLGLYLADVNTEIARIDEGFVPNDPDHLHMTFSEIAHSDTARREIVRSGAEIARYYMALVDNFPSMQPIICNFLRIMPTPDPAPDPEHPEKRPISLVAALLPEGEEIFKVRANLSQALIVGGLPTSDLGVPRVFFVTLGRFKEIPAQSGIPLLEQIDRMNRGYKDNLNFEIDDMEIVSTASRYVFSSGHLFLSPPIPFNKEKRSHEYPRFVRPSLRRAV